MNTRTTPFRLPLLAATALLAAGCAALAPAAPPPAAAPPEGLDAGDMPVLVAAPRLVAEAPRPTPTVAPTATPRPTPTPAPVWTVKEAAKWLVRYPQAWEAAPGDAGLLLTRAGTTGALELRDEASTQTLQQAQDAAREAAGLGLIRAESATLDGLRGFLVVANADRPDGGKRRLATRGFLYAGRLWTLTASWDPRDEAAAGIEADVRAVLETFRWL